MGATRTTINRSSTLRLLDGVQMSAGERARAEAQMAHVEALLDRIAAFEAACYKALQSFAAALRAISRA